MEQFRNIKISDFNYGLPETKIAKYPLPERDKSKLLVWENGKISADSFENCVEYLPKNAQLVFNNTRVIHARLLFTKGTGAKIEIFCLEPVEPADYQIAFQAQTRVVWKCMVGNSKKWKSGHVQREIVVGGKKTLVRAEKIARDENTFHIEFSWDTHVSFAEIITQAGTLPIPPYLKRETEDSDEQSYQTVYAKIDGSVAAPTAGLHFTERIFNKLSTKNISANEITLHVGAGTFQPVKAETIDGHRMHHETVIVPKKIIEGFIENPEKIIAVGTTSVRSLESLYWIGLQLENKTLNVNKPEILQWEAYENKASISTNKALCNIVDFLAGTNQSEIQFSTQIIILPGYSFKIVSGMFTNFHQPQSTLLLLISAFLGEKWNDVYQFALNNNFRFLSYGDSNLYLK